MERAHATFVHGKLATCAMVTCARGRLLAALWAGADWRAAKMVDRSKRIASWALTKGGGRRTAAGASARHNAPAKALPGIIQPVSAPWASRRMETLAACEARSAKIRLLSPSAGVRGVHEPIHSSKEFLSFIKSFIQVIADPLDPVAITSGGGVGGDGEQFADLVEGVAVPELQNNDLALFRRQLGQALHRPLLLGRFAGRRLEPAPGFQFAEHATQKSPLEVQSPVSDGADGVVGRPFGGGAESEQAFEHFLERVLGLAVAEPQGAGVKDQVRRLFLVQLAAPTGVGWK